MKNDIDPVLDAKKLRERIDDLGLTQFELAELMDVSRTTVVNILGTGYAKEETLRTLCRVLRISREELLRKPTFQEPEETMQVLATPNDWKLISIESPTLIAANGVSYQVAKLQNELNPERFSRGKFYSLLHLAPATLAEKREHLRRHSKVCASLHGDPRIGSHFDVRRLSEDTAWWVLDEWIEGDSLDHRMETLDPLDHATIKAIGSEILLALESLHRNKIVVRELAPERIIVLANSNRCVLTDFELAKLLDSDISVKGKWKLANPYRAPEISGDDYPLPQSDLFSWATIVTEMLTQNTESSDGQLKESVRNKSISDLIEKCRQPVYAKRPNSASSVLGAWNGWEVQK